MDDNAMNRDITIWAKRFVEQLIAKCACQKYWYAKCSVCAWEGTANKANGGHPLGNTGDFHEVTCPNCDSEDELEDAPCPKCADLRRLAGELGAHYTIDRERDWASGTYNYWCNCGKVNCTELEWTVQSTRKLLERMGEWEGFIKWHEKEAYGFEECSVPHEVDPIINWTLGAYASADILTSVSLLMEAVIEYLRGRINEKV